MTKNQVTLSADQYSRLALSGAICTVLVRTALNPLELVKTKVQLGNDEVKEMARRYVEKWDRVPGGRKAITKLEGEEKMGKLDDLADCLLQGMAWVEWENNKRIVMKHGIEALLDT